MLKKILSKFFPCMRKRKSRYSEEDFNIDNYSAAWAELIDNNKNMDVSIKKSFDIMAKMKNNEELSTAELKHLGIVKISKN